ncbi:MAG: hypothetical protein ACXWZS_03715 [Gemmatirosa sp.]
MTTRAIGAAIALTISAGAAAAQTPTQRDSTPTRVRKDTPSTMPVRKETPAPAPAPAPMTPAPAPTPAPVAMDTAPRIDSTTSVTTTTTTTVASTGEVQPPMTRTTRFGNGLYLGVQGGANFPQNEINSYYETGYGAGAQLGWDPQNSPLGLRVNAMWNRLNGKDLLNQTVNGVRYEADLPNADLYSAFADAKLRLPFGRFLGATSGLYAVGGGGVTYFRNFNDFGATTGTPSGGSVTNTFNNEDVTRFSLNGGGGLSFGVGNVSLFVESRYVRTFTQGRDTDYVPVTLGITFH